MVIVLGKISEKNCIQNLDRLSHQLLNDQVIVGEGGNIRFEKRDK